ncbi:MAG: outer membrane receptor protein involved in Fe transport [Saprospiraceae bacterium]
MPRFWLNSGLWYLRSQQEFVYVGDEAIVEPSGRSRRKGVELSLRLQLNDYLFMNTDVNYTHARSIDNMEDNNLIPLAPDFTSTGGFAFKHPSGFSSSLNYRYIKDRSATENNSINAKGYFIMEFASYFEFKKAVIALSIDNLLNSEWNEAQFATESRLRNETISVEELHFTPGIPRFIKGSIRFKF